MGNDGGKFDVSDRVTADRLNRKTLVVDTGASLAALAAYPGMIAFCTVSGSGFTGGVTYRRNAANTAWEEMIDSVSTQNIAGAKTFTAGITASGANHNFTETSITRLDSIRGRSDSGHIQIYSGAPGGSVYLNTKNAAGTDTQRVIVKGNADQGKAGITVYEPVDFGHALAGLVNPRLFLRNRMMYSFMSVDDFAQNIAGTVTIQDGHPGVDFNSLGAGDAVALSALQIRRDRKWEMTCVIKQAAFGEPEFEVGFSSDASDSQLSSGTDQYVVFRYDHSADNSYHCVTSNGTTTTNIDTSVAPADGDILFMENDENEIKFYINGTLVSTHAADLPDLTTSLNLRFFNRGESGGSASNYFSIRGIVVVKDEI
jgi:hypothetical protein